MRRILLLLLWQFGLPAGTLLFADVVTLKDGRQVSGLVESGNTQELHIKAGDQSQTIDVHQIQSIQFSVSLPPTAAAPSPKAANVTPTAPEAAPAQPNGLFLNDGAHVAGRWWSIDDTDLQFLVDNQLQQYPRRNVSGVTFGNATLPPPPAPSTPATSAQPAASTPKPARAPAVARSAAPPPAPSTPATSAQAPASAPQPARAPALARPPAAPPQQPPTLTKPSGNGSSSEPSRGLSQPEQIGMVYFWNGKVLIPLELSQAVQRKSGSSQYWEMPAPQSRVRLNESGRLVFILRLPKGADPAGYSLFPLATVDGSRRTRSQPGRRDGLETLPVDIETNDASNLMTYALTVRDLQPGEYSFSPSSSNDSYCFGVDPSAPGQ